MTIDDLVAIARLWLAHIVITSPIVVPVVWLTRRLVQWQACKSVVFVVPFAVWLVLILYGWRPKSLANLGECAIISGAIVVAAPRAGTIRQRPDTALVRVVVLAAVTAVGVAAYLLTPVWPE